MREKVETLANFKHMLVGLLLGLPLVRFQSIQKKIASKSSCLDKLTGLGCLFWCHFGLLGI